MSKEKSSESSKPQDSARDVTANATKSSTPASKRRSRGKGNRPQIGGTAVSSAKSVQPRATAESKDPNQQQIESYNRTMRRRMEHIGAGPYAQEQRVETMKKKRQKKLETQKERRVEAQQELKQSMRGFGKRNLSLFLGTIGVIVLIIIIFLLLHVYHVL